MILLKCKSDSVSLLLQTCYGSQSHLWKCSGSYSPTWAPARITSPLTIVFLLLIWLQSCWSPSCSLNQHSLSGCRALYRLSPTCLLYNTLSSFGSLLRTYLLQKLHFYHSIYFCNYSSPKPDHSNPIYPDLFPPLYNPLFLTYCMIPLFIMFIIHFLSTWIRK